MIVQGKWHGVLSFRFDQLRLGRDDEPLDPNFTEFPQSLTVDEGGKAKFTCKMSGSVPMTGKRVTTELDVALCCDRCSHMAIQW